MLRLREGGQHVACTAAHQVGISTANFISVHLVASTVIVGAATANGTQPVRFQFTGGRGGARSAPATHASALHLHRRPRWAATAGDGGATPPRASPGADG